MPGLGYMTLKDTSFDDSGELPAVGWLTIHLINFDPRSLDAIIRFGVLEPLTGEASVSSKPSEYHLYDKSPWVVSVADATILKVALTFCTLVVSVGWVAITIDGYTVTMPTFEFAG